MGVTYEWKVYGDSKYIRDEFGLVKIMIHLFDHEFVRAHNISFIEHFVVI